MDGGDPAVLDLAVVGAGPAGVSLAYFVKTLNPRLRIALFDRASHVGGRCRSFIDAHGFAHDLGAIEEAANYAVMRELVDAAGVRRMPHVPMRWRAPSTCRHGPVFTLGALRRYARLCDAHGLLEPWDFTRFADDPVRLVPLDELVARHRLAPLQELFFNRAFGLYGYGSLRQIPAGLAFSYIDRRVLASAVAHHVPALTPWIQRYQRPPVVFLRDGFQRVFENLVVQMHAAPSPLQIHLLNTVRRIEPAARGVVVQTDRGAWRARAACVTSGWDRVAMPHVDRSVTTLFQRLVHEEYGSTVFRTRAPMPYAGVMDTHAGDHAPLMWITKHPDARARTTGIAYTRRALRSSELEQALHENGIELAPGDTVARQYEPYHVRFTMADVAAGAYRTLDEHQGRGGVFFAGAVLSFDLTEAVAALSKRLSRRVAEFLSERAEARVAF